MDNIDYDACYAALQLTSGANLKEVNAAWRRLSRIHHPDQHTLDPKAHKQALEKQKQLNNARDVLKKWFEHNPAVLPPRKAKPTGTGPATNGSSSSSSSGKNNTSGTKTNSGSHHSHNHQNQSHAGCSAHWHNCHDHYSSGHATKPTSGARTNPQTEPMTGWFVATDLKLSPLQSFIRGLDRPDPNRKDQMEIIGVVMGFAAVFGPLCLIGSVIRFLFPDLPSDFPEWLQMAMLVASGSMSWYLFRWFFAESEIIRLQEKVLYFKTDRSLANCVEFLKLVIGKQKTTAAEWTFSPKGAAQEAVLEYEEEILREWKIKRRLVVKFAAKSAPNGVVIALEVKAKSPVNSFSCNRFAKAIISDLKKDLQELVA